MMFSFLGVISRLVFATPLGIVLVITAGVWYMMRSRDSSSRQESTFENPNDETHEEEDSMNPEEDIQHSHKAPLRDADDVDFTEIDD